MDPTTQGAVAALLTSLGYGQWVPVAFALIGLASALAAVLPKAFPGRKALDVAALNVGNATNAE